MKKITTLLLTLVVIMTTGCGAKPSSNAALPAASSELAGSNAIGSILLSINPEIKIDYDDKGIVISLEGKNEDGKKVLEEYTDYEGKSCETIVDELVKKIYADGYFEKKVDGHEKNIILKLEDDSLYPDDAFLKNLEQKLQDTIKECNLTSSPILVEKKDLDDKGLITLEKAKEIVLTQLGLSSAEFTKAAYDPEDNTYEMEFTVDGITYEFEVNASNGKVLEVETDTDNDDIDDTDEDDDQDDTDDDQDDIDDDQYDIDDDEDDDQDDIDDDKDDDQDDLNDTDDDKDDGTDSDDDDRSDLLSESYEKNRRLLQKWV